MVLLAAFKALIHRYSGAVDVVIGTPVEGRRDADVEQVVGLFINTLVLRTDLDGDPSFTALLARIRETTLDAQAHQDVPFERLVEARFLESADAFLLIAINHAENPKHVTLTFPPDIPEAIWQNMETGAAVNFVLGPNGPIYTRSFAPRGVMVPSPCTLTMS